MLFRFKKVLLFSPLKMMVRAKCFSIPKKNLVDSVDKVWQVTKKIPQKYPYKTNILLYFKILHASQILNKLLPTPKAFRTISKADIVIVFIFICRMQLEEIIQIIRTTAVSTPLIL